MVVSILTKYCTGCNTDLPLSMFWKNKTNKDGLQHWCKDCWKQITDKRRNGPKRDIELRQRKNRHLIRNYNITINEYEQMLAKQRGLCAICESPMSLNSQMGRKLAVDHDHSTGKVRGLLCENCNRGLGMFKDSPHLLSMAILYLRSIYG